jgi:hypothetical protein
MLSTDAGIMQILNDYYPQAAIRCLEQSGARVHVLSKNERYQDASGVLRRLQISTDTWPVPPAGLFVVEERTVYLRSTSAMTVCHEIAHALDCALGRGVYLSGIDPRIRRAFGAATAFVTPYAASACDEYFAECIRAWVEANDAHSLWPRATRERLSAVDPRMSALVSEIFEDLEVRFGAAKGEQMALGLSA